MTVPPVSLVDAVLDRFPESLPAFLYMSGLWAVRRLEGGPFRAQLQGWVEADAKQIGPDVARAVRDLIRQAEAPPW